MKQPIRILQVVGKMDRAGAETLLMNLYRRMDRDKVQFDFLTHRFEQGDYDGEIASLGGKIYSLCPMKAQNFPQYIKQARSFFSEHPEYRIVHSHIDAMSFLPLAAAKKAEVPIRIAHSHNTAFPKDLKYPVRLLARKLLPLAANRYFACSNPAGEFLFPKSVPFQILPNAIELDRFRFSPKGRKMKRLELGLTSDQFVIGHIGRFNQQKNHSFLIKIFAHILKLDPGAVLVMAGQGELEQQIKKQAEELGLGSSVRFLGVRSDIPELLWAMDLFLLPSLYEGFPVVGVEAQASGVPCLLSETIREDIKLTSSLEFLPLSAPPQIWAEKAMALRRVARGSGDGLAEKGFNIANQAQWMQEYYLKSSEEANAWKKY